MPTCLNTNSALQILLAEDNENDSTILRIALERAKVAAHLHVVSDGEEAIAYLKGENRYADRVTYPVPDILLLDLNMPRRNGMEVLEWIRNDEIYQYLIVHVFSASSRAEDVKRVYELHANSYAVKPSRLDDLTSFIHGLVTWHRFAVLPLLPTVRARPSES